MKKLIFATVGACLLTFGLAYADKVHDWKDLDKVHHHVEEVHKKLHESVEEMGRARAANHYDMAGHGAKAEDDLKKAEELVHHAKDELHEAVEAAKAAK